MRRLVTAVTLLVLPVSACAAAGHPGSVTSSHPRTSTQATSAHRTTYTDWPSFHRTPGKTGLAIGVVHLPLHRAWRRHLDGSVWSEPILVNGILIAATEHNAVYGLKPSSGKVLWHQKLGTPEPLSEQSTHGDIDPLGITGSPAYDPKTGSVFVVTTTGHGHHTLWALDAATGHKRWHRDADVDKKRTPDAEQQRAALLVVDNRVIVTYGAHSGDESNYVGYALAARTDGKGRIPFWAVPNQRQAGMWGPAGPVEAYDGNVLTPTANGSDRNPNIKWDKSDGVVELTPTMHYVRGWAPKNWEQGDADDLSLGSTSPVRVDGKYVVGGKRGEVWLLKKSLGGVDGQLDTFGSDYYCDAFGGIAAKGDIAVIPCKNFTTPHGVLALTVKGNRLHRKWYARGLYGAPIIAGKRVFVADLDSGDEKVLSLATGKVIASVPVGALATFPSSVVDGNHVFVGTLDGVTALKGS